jgi:predicted nucleic acid-binding protein
MSKVVAHPQKPKGRAGAGSRRGIHRRTRNDGEAPPAAQVLKNAADNRILECAIASGADAIVTGDKALLALGEYSVRIVSLRH